MKKFNQSIIDMLQKPVPRLIYALVCGVAYFIIIMQFVSAYTVQTGLMGLFIAPAVICGGALIIVKMLRNTFENVEEDEPVNNAYVLTLFYTNLGIIAIAVLRLCVLAMGV